MPCYISALTHITYHISYIMKMYHHCHIIYIIYYTSRLPHCSIIYHIYDILLLPSSLPYHISHIIYHISSLLYHPHHTSSLPYYILHIISHVIYNHIIHHHCHITYHCCPTCILTISHMIHRYTRDVTHV